MNNNINDKTPILSIELLHNNYDENMFTSDEHINPKYNSLKKTGIISKIFEDNWELFYEKNKDLIDLYE